MFPTTGIDYPTIELGGKIYTVKFSRAILYRMGKAGIELQPKPSPIPGMVQLGFSNLVDVLHAATGFEGTPEQLAELVYEKRNEASTAIFTAWGKAFPLPQQVAPEPAGIPTGVKEQVQ